ncbi:MAG: rubrerythrin family protein, partial [Nanoarchaeota archaeon]
ILGVLAGLTFVLDKTITVGIVGMITGVAAALSMASSEYLAAKEDEHTRNKRGKMALVTGVSYFLAVVVMILPYLLFEEKNIALVLSVFISLSLIFVYNFYISNEKENLLLNFLKMAGISLGVAVISLMFGILVKKVFGVNI